MTGPVQDSVRAEGGAVAATERAAGQENSGAWELVAAVQAGDREAFGRLYERYLPQIHGFVRRRVWDAGLVEDLTSETFLRALRRIDTLTERRSDPGAWLVRIARNLVFDHAKSARNRMDWVTDEVPEPRTSASGERGVEERAQARADRAAAAATVARCLDRLTPEQRRAVELYDLAPERSVTAAAAVMGRSETAVKGLRHRGLHAMREQLTGEGLSCSQDCYDAAQRRPAQQRPRGNAAGLDEDADDVPGDSSADRDARDEHSATPGETDVAPPEVERPAEGELAGGVESGEVERGGTGAEWDSAPVDEIAVAVGRVCAALTRLRTVHTQTAGGEEPRRAERVARWHTDDHTGRDKAADGRAADGCVERERSPR